MTVHSASLKSKRAMVPSRIDAEVNHCSRPMGIQFMSTESSAKAYSAASCATVGASPATVVRLTSRACVSS